MDDRILNVGLDLAMEWGEHWLKPIQERLHRLYPQLSAPELDGYNEVCREAMRVGHAQAGTSLRQAAGNQEEAFRLFTTAVLARFPWVSDHNLHHLFSQGLYYAWRDGDFS